MQYTILRSPVGYITVEVTDAGEVTALRMHAEPTPAPGLQDGPATQGAVRQLAEYFDGSRTAFDLPLKAAGTPFQRRVWGELAGIGYGQTMTYGQIARLIGAPTSFRAVGTAIGRNPVSIIVPCHRVVGSSGALTGYAHGVDRKQWLLAHEQAALVGA